MKKQTDFFLPIVLVMFMITTANAFDNTSFRLNSMGIELKWIVDDEYTDILQNPATINILTANWILTNFSNYSGNYQQFLNYGNNYYKGSSGSYLIGSFYQFSNWNVGLIGDFWTDKRWNSLVYRMNTDFSDYYEFNWYGFGYEYEEGTWITDYNNETDTNSDDWRITEERNGTNYYSGGSGLDLKLFFGRPELKEFGFSYQLKYSKSNTPVSYDPWGNPSGMLTSNASHSYTLMEVGTNSPNEAVTAVQEEVNEYANKTINHIFSIGMTKQFNDGTNLDLVAGLVYINGSANNETRRRKQIDFDPDNDNVSFESYYYDKSYNQYSYQSLESFKSNLSGVGSQFDGRYSKQLNDRVQIRIIGNLFYESLSSDDYEEQTTMQESMTTFEGGNEFDNSSDTRRYGKKEDNSFASLFGIGGLLQPRNNLLIGFGLKWYYNFDEIIYDLNTDKEGTTQIYKDEEKNHFDRIALPIGLEYRFKEKYAFRLGVNTNFYSLKSTTAFTGVEETDSYSQYSNVSSIDYNSNNTTSYSYGFGYRFSDNINLDITGITNLTDISNLYISLIFNF